MINRPTFLVSFSERASLEASNSPGRLSRGSHQRLSQIEKDNPDRISDSGFGFRTWRLGLQEGRASSYLPIRMSQLIAIAHLVMPEGARGDL